MHGAGGHIALQATCVHARWNRILPGLYFIQDQQVSTVRLAQSISAALRMRHKLTPLRAAAPLRRELQVWVAKRYAMGLDLLLISFRIALASLLGSMMLPRTVRYLVPAPW